ncbi:MAG: hypothetical protein QXE01_04175 [Sulfolobales archaeon]
MGSRVLGAIALLILALAMYIPRGVEAQALAEPSVIAVDLDKRTVYRGYQWVEVTAYIYIPPGGSIVSLSGVANLSAGITTITPLAWVQPVSPVTKVVGNVSYSISNLLTARIHIPYGAIAGRGELVVSISLVARVGNTTYTPSYVFRFPITILDHTPVERTRTEAQIRLENARTVLSLLEAVSGVSMPDLKAMLDNLSARFDRADVLLYEEGDVDRALSMYGDVIRDSTGIVSQAIALFLSKQRESSLALESRLSRIEANISSSIARISALERSVASAAEAIRTNEASIRSLASALANYSNTINTYLSTLDKSIIDTNRKIDTLAQTINAAIGNMSTGINNRLNSLSSALSQVQLAIVVVAVMMLISIAIVGILRRG